MFQFLTAADTTAAGTGAVGGGAGGLLLYYVVMIGGIILLFYFMAVRPQKKQQRKQEELMSSIAIGDSVLTTAGFYGVVIDIINEEVIVVEFGSNKNCRIPMKKHAVVEVEKPEVEDTKKKEKE